MRMPKDISLFKRASRLEGLMDEFLDTVSEAGLIFRQVVDIYLEQGLCDEFQAKVEKISEVESRCDDLRRDIETQLFEYTLIPDLRGDVLSLIEGMDVTINLYEDNAKRFNDEIPDIPKAFHKDFLELTSVVVDCVETTVMAARGFFRNVEAVRDHIHKVSFYESEADDIASRIVNKAFRSNLDLAHKSQLRYFVGRIDAIANAAEDISDYLAIYTIKRRI